MSCFLDKKILLILIQFLVMKDLIKDWRFFFWKAVFTFLFFLLCCFFLWEKEWGVYRNKKERSYFKISLINFFGKTTTWGLLLFCHRVCLFSFWLHFAQIDLWASDWLTLCFFFCLLLVPLSCRSFPPIGCFDRHTQVPQRFLHVWIVVVLFFT